MSSLLIVVQSLVLKIERNALKGSRFFISLLTPAISILISGIYGERGDVSLDILKSYLVNTQQNRLFKTSFSLLLMTMVSS